MRFVRKRWISLAFLLATGCARLPLTAPLPAGMEVFPVSRVEKGSPFAWEPAGRRVALVRDGLRIVTLASGEDQVASSASPAALAWTPDGESFAAAFPEKDVSFVRIFAMDGRRIGEARMEGRVGRLFWLPNGDILASSVKLDLHSFGGGMKATLYRWDGRGEPLGTTLGETTVKPLTLRDWGGLLYRTVNLSISPFGDEILYTRLYDPPAFSPYLKVILRHLESGREREIASVAITSGGGVFSPDGEEVLYGDGIRESRLVDPWRGVEVSSRPLPGRGIALSPGGRHILIDGRLFREGKEIAAFPPGSAGEFSPRGDRLLLSSEGRLYLVEGLGTEPSGPIVPVVRERLLKLRRWRSEGLITPEEYRAVRERIQRQ